MLVPSAPPYPDSGTDNVSEAGMTSSYHGRTNNLDRPDILQNLQWSHEEKQPYKEKLGLDDRKNIAFEENDIPAGNSEIPRKPESSADKRVRRRRRMKRVVSIFGWVFCCPFMTLGLARRERPVDDDDLRDDPCLPCMYDSNPELSR